MYIIAAVNNEGLLGIKKDGKYSIPWKYKTDLLFFKNMTKGHTVIMGKNTYISIGKPLPDRKNVVITKTPLSAFNEDLESYPSISEALKNNPNSVWFIGGSEIYREAMNYANIIYLTIVPDIIKNEGEKIYFPWINPDIFDFQGSMEFEDDKRLKLAKYFRKKTIKLFLDKNNES